MLAKENAALRELAESQGARITQLEGKLEAVMRTVSKLANDSMMVRGRAEGEWSFDDSPPLHDDAAACTITLCGGQVEVHGQVQGIGTEEIEQWMLEQQQISHDCGHLAQFNPARPELRLDAAVSECGAIQFTYPGIFVVASQRVGFRTQVFIKQPALVVCQNNIEQRHHRCVITPVLVDADGCPRVRRSHRVEAVPGRAGIGPLRRERDLPHLPLHVFSHVRARTPWFSVFTGEVCPCGHGTNK